MTRPMTVLENPSRLPRNPSRLPCRAFPAMIKATLSSRAQVVLKRAIMPNPWSKTLRPEGVGGTLQWKSLTGERMHRRFLSPEKIAPEEIAIPGDDIARVGGVELGLAYPIACGAPVPGGGRLGMMQGVQVVVGEEKRHQGIGLHRDDALTHRRGGAMFGEGAQKGQRQAGIDVKQQILPKRDMANRHDPNQNHRHARQMDHPASQLDLVAVAQGPQKAVAR